MKNKFYMLILILILPLAACGKNKTVDAIATPDKVLVGTISPERGDIIITGEYIGSMQPVQQVAILPRFPGEVISVYFNVGDSVEVGDVLFTIDTADIETNIAALEAQLAVQDATVQAAQTGLSLVEGSAMQSQMLSAAGGVAQAEAGVKQAEHNLEQAVLGIEQAQMGYDLAAQAFADTTLLFEAGVVARSAFEQAEAGYSNAQASLERANIGFSMSEIALSQAKLGREQALEGQRILLEEAPAENRRRAQDGLAQAQAARNIILVNLENARDMLNDANVTSPINGVVEMRSVEPFGRAMPQSPSFLISAQDSMTVSFRVPRNSVSFLKIGDAISLHDGEAILPGTITEIGTMVDFGGLITISASIPNPPATLLSGTSVRVFATAQTANNTLILPLGAIHHERGVAKIYVAENGIARSVEVETGIFDAEFIQIVNGLDENARVINTWSARLSDGIDIEF
ncbi:MAG: HlyD family efflux transporter periplasmic adaptor subunit [Defluviitaleaceae bacterium]|nr:HlyD family efflux transporter periplasmic adaptor subunit [Defluviitaleaceae bacterium]